MEAWLGSLPRRELRVDDLARIKPFVFIDPYQLLRLIAVRILRSKIFLLFVLLIGAGGLWRYVIADRFAKQRWDAYVKDAHARGLRMTLGEYRPVSVPPEEDISRLPIFASRKKFALSLGNVPALCLGKRGPKGTLRPIDWKETRSSLTRLGIADDATELDDVWAVNAAILPLQPIVDQLCESKAVAGNWGDEFWKLDFTIGFNQPTEAMRLFSLLRVRANLDLELNRPDMARRSIGAQMRLAKVFIKTPTLIMWLVSAAGISQVQESFWRGMEMDRWDDSSLREFAQMFLEENLIADFQWSMETERAFVRDQILDAIGDGDRMMQFIGVGKFADSPIEKWLLQFAVSRPSWAYDNQIWYERAQDEVASMLDGDDQVWRPVEQVYDPAKLNYRQRNRDLVLAATSMTMMQSFLQKAVWMHAQTKMAAIACGLELARRASGSYPTNLDELCPKFLPKLPVDPATGAKFRYERQRNGSYLLYSLGMDRLDQGGERESIGQSEPTDADWPWWHPCGQSAVMKE